jgi:hypothetical protein
LRNTLEVALNEIHERGLSDDGRFEFALTIVAIVKLRAAPLEAANDVGRERVNFASRILADAIQATLEERFVLLDRQFEKQLERGLCDTGRGRFQVGLVVDTAVQTPQVPR